MKTLTDLLSEEIRDLYVAEHEILMALPMLIESASSEPLKKDLKKRLGETQIQIKRLEDVGKNIDARLTGIRCKGMESLLTEGEELIKKARIGQARDALLIASAQKAEHYEIARYSSAVIYARRLNRPDMARYLGATLREKKETDRALSHIAANGITHAIPA